MSSTMKAVKEAEPDPKAGKPRGKSGVSFPYWDLDKSIEVAKAIHEKAGGSADTSQAASLLGYSGVENGNFRTRMSAAKMFGLIENTDDRKIRVSQRGRTIIAPVTPADARRARVDAFMEVELFKKVFDRFNGTTLPEQVGLKNLLETEYRVVPDRVAPTVRVLLDSAEQAGLFEVNNGLRTKMVLPLGLSSSPPAPQPNHSHQVEQHHEKPRHSGGGGGNGSDGTEGIDPAILGLLKRLPPGGTPMIAKRREALINAFTNVVSFIYPDAEDSP